MEILKLKKLKNLGENIKKRIKIILIMVMVVMLCILGFSLFKNGWGLKELLTGPSWIGAEVLRDKEGNIVSQGGKYTYEYNCGDFDTQSQAKNFFDKVGGPRQDTKKLDSDNDGEVCEVLPDYN